MIRPTSHSQIAATLAALDVKISKILYFLLSSSPQHIDSISKNALDDLSDQGNYLILLDLFILNPVFVNSTNARIQHCTTGHLINEAKKPILIPARVLH